MVITCTVCGCDFEPAGQRSSRANAYLFGVCYKLIAKELGYSVDEIHEAMKQKFRSREDLTTGLIIVRSTRTGSPDFWAYVDEVRHWSHTFLGVYIPEPNEVPSEVAA